MQKTRASIGLPIDGLHLLEHLIETKDFRNKIPSSLHDFIKLLGASGAFLLELLPSFENQSEFQYRSILEVNAQGGQTTHQVPSELRNETLSFSSLLEWVVEASSMDAEPIAATLPSVLHASSREDEAYQRLHADKICQSIISTTKADFSSFMLFPLVYHNYLWGVLLVSHHSEHEWQVASQRYGQTFAKLLARLLSEAYHDQQAINKQHKTQEVDTANLLPLPTARKQPVEQAESKLSSFIENFQMGIWEWDWETDIISVNDIILNIIGLPRMQSRLTKDEFTKLIIEPDRARLHDVMNYHLEQGTENYQIEIRMARQGMEPRWVQLHGRAIKRQGDDSPIRFIGSFIKIHDNKIAELRLQKGEALLQAIVEAIPDTKFWANSSGKILAVYSSKEEPLYQDLEYDQVVGKQLDDVFPFAVATGLKYNAKLALEQKTLQTFEFSDDLLTEKERRLYEARINAINNDEYILILRDVSTIKQAQQALTEQIREVDRKNRELKAYIESNLQLENFAYIASHDLREPARTMRTFSQFLKKRAGDQLDKDSKMYLDFIITGADRMNQLIQDLLKYSRVNSEPFEQESIVVKTLLQEIITQLKSSIQENQAEISISKLPEKIQGSTTRLRQLFQNLISNSIKFHQPHQPPKIIISAQESSTHWQFTVSDNGIGIDPEFHEQVFTIFKKLHNNQAYEGTGIGLALVKRIIAQHEGEIWLESALGKGTTIHFTLSK